MVVVVTGASKVIGFELVKLYSESPSYMVIAVSRNTQSLTEFVKKNKTTNLLVVKADITKDKSIQEIKKLISKLKLPVAALINNAGSILNKNFLQIQKKEIEQVYSTNLIAPFMLSQVKFHLWVKHQEGIL